MDEDLLSAVSAQMRELWSSRGWTSLEPWDGDLTARSLEPRSFFALAHRSEVRWIWRQIVRQPSEARYGRSPVRQVRSSQIRVLTRPAPPDLFETFVASLRHPGLGLDEHELRMRPVDWRVRDLGVHGVGWMVLIDGLLVARWVELRQVGGAPVEPPAIDVTYGVERLALVLSAARSLLALQRAVSAEVASQRLLEEQELSRHLLEILDETELMQDLERELGSAERALEARLALPAYEAILRGVARAEVLRARGAFRTLREARAGIRLTELSSACRRLAGSERRADTSRLAGSAFEVEDTEESKEPADE